MNKIKSIRKTSLNKIAAARRQAGVSGVQVVVSLAVGALILLSGIGAFKYIEQQKMNNDMAELTDIRAGLVDFASKHNTSFSAFSKDIGCKQQVFPAVRCSGTGASTAISNTWGGSYDFTVVNVSGGTNNGARLSSTGYSDVACAKEIGYQWDQWAKIEVGTTVVKSTATQTIDDAGINTACAGGTNTIYWTVRA